MELEELFENNRRWAASMVEQDADIFLKLSRQQAPQFLWIGCSDSRVPANEIVDLLPGELFVHRNVANIVVHTDLNCLSVIQYAVDVLKVSHVIVCGHYGCGGVQAAIRNSRLGLIENWLRHVQDVRLKHDAHLCTIKDETPLIKRMCELNVIEQAVSVCQTTIVQDAWARGQSLTVHGWIYSIEDGLLRNLGICASNMEELTACYRAAIGSSPAGQYYAVTV
ncbi:MAG: carbonate dehydratase [Gammaproteobacteria bacterium]|nr:MAG: carbonate dehydratase [Gammaproteobacteria bacterium]TND02150.1 MAG: carbonate dehydratase [Gammaproteobacteria bacterium]